MQVLKLEFSSDSSTDWCWFLVVISICRWTYFCMTCPNLQKKKKKQEQCFLHPNSAPNSRPPMGARCFVIYYIVITQTQKLLWKRRKALLNFCDNCASGQAGASHRSAVTSGMLTRPSASGTLVPCLKKVEDLQLALWQALCLSAVGRISAGCWSTTGVWFRSVLCGWCGLTHLLFHYPCSFSPFFFLSAQ